MKKNLVETVEKKDYREELLEAFEALEGLDEFDPKMERPNFDLNDADDISALAAYLDNKGISGEEDIDLMFIDPEADDVEDLKEPEEYLGKAILSCLYCHAFHDCDDENLVVSDETVDLSDDEKIYNIDTECPYCHHLEGFKKIGYIGNKEVNTEPEETAAAIEDREDADDAVNTHDDFEAPDNEDELNESLTEAKHVIEANNKKCTQYRIDYFDGTKKLIPFSEFVNYAVDDEYGDLDSINRIDAVDENGEFGIDIEMYPCYTEEEGIILAEGRGNKNRKILGNDLEYVKELYYFGESLTEDKAKSIKHAIINKEIVGLAALDQLDKDIDKALNSKINKADFEAYEDSWNYIMHGEDDAKIVKAGQRIGAKLDKLKKKLNTNESLEEDMDDDDVFPKHDEDVCPKCGKKPCECKEDCHKSFKLEDIDENNFNKLANDYLTEVYANVKEFKVTKGSVDSSKNQLVLEGLLTFKSGKEQNTKFVFEADTMTKRGKARFIGLNETFSTAKKAFVLQGKLEEGKLIPESLQYNYYAKNLNESKNIHGSTKIKLTEAIVEDLNKNEIGKFLEDSVKACLKDGEEESGTYRLILDKDLCLYVGWEDGFEGDNGHNGWEVCAKIAKRNDFD